jgi:hypothetical protein
MSDSIFGQQCFKILVTKMSFFITDDGPNSTESDINILAQEIKHHFTIIGKSLQLPLSILIHSPLLGECTCCCRMKERVS